MIRDLFAGMALVVTVAAELAAAPSTTTLETQAARVAVETIASKLSHPWGMAFLPDGRMLVTQRSGELRIIGQDGKVSDSVRGTPKVFARGQGGLLDVALAPDFDSSGLVYLSYAEAGEGGAGTAVARGRLESDRLDSVEVIFRQQPKVDGGNHFGSRLVFARDGKLFVTLGERFKFDPAQDLKSHLGKIVRINADGSVPRDNPFSGKQDVRPEIWSYGHRNIQGAALHPRTNALWIHEMGPRGGDELTIPQAGHNYGWPLVSWGNHYDGKDIPDPPTRPDLAGSLHHWNPAIAPSGMAFYTGSAFPGWRDNLLIGGLVSQGIHRVTLNGEKVSGEERIPLGARIRDVRQGPDGLVYVLTDEESGRVLRLKPDRQEAERPPSR